LYNPKKETSLPHTSSLPPILFYYYYFFWVFKF
jgi:hypothetical protein